MRLARLGGLGAEPVDERLQVLALRLLLLGELRIEQLALAARALERRVAAAVERELGALEMQDPVDRGVEQVAIVADDDDGVRIARDVLFEPQRRFEIEIVGRLVEQQEIGLGEQHRRQRHPHAPAAGELRAGTLLVGVGESEAGQDAGGPRRRRVGADVGEPRLDFRDAMVIALGLRLPEQPRALGIGGEHDVDQALRPARRFLRKPAEAGARPQRHGAAVGRHLAGDQAEQRRSCRCRCVPTRPTRASAGNAHGGAIDQEAPGDAHGEIVDRQHGGYLAEPGRSGKRQAG